MNAIIVNITTSNLCYQLDIKSVFNVKDRQMMSMKLKCTPKIVGSN